MTKILLNDTVTFNLTDIGETSFKLFLEENKDICANVVVRNSYHVEAPFWVAMYFLTENDFDDLVEGDLLKYDDVLLFFNCKTYFTLTDEGADRFGTGALSSKLRSVFEYMALDSNCDEWESLIKGEIHIDEKSFYSIKAYEIERMDQKVFCLERENFRITLSKPHVTPFHCYKFETMEDAMYFYYDMTIEENVNYKCDAPKWKIVSNEYVYEFGMIPSLPTFVNEIQKMDIERMGKEIKNEYRHQFVFHDILSGFCDEDNYELFKYKNMNNGFEWYDFACFFGNSQMSSNLLGVRFTMLNKYDLNIIKEWAQNFLDYTEMVTRKHVKEKLEKDSSNKEIKNGKLYVYQDNEKTIIDTIIMPGDRCSVNTYDEESKYITIKQFENNTIVATNTKAYELSKLLYIRRDLNSNDKELSYDKNQCREEIQRRLGDVLEQDIDLIINAAIDSAWLCRTEHPFNSEKENNGKKIAEEILLELKNSINSGEN